MDITKKLKALDKEQNALDRKYKNSQEEYIQYITDKNIPVLKRWKFFIKAPSKLKKSFGIVDFETKMLQGYMESFESGPGPIRGEKIVMEDIFEDYIHPDITQEELDYLAQNYLRCDTLTKEDIEEAMEEVLSINIEYITYDW